MYCTAPLSPRKGRLRSFRDDDDDDDDDESRKKRRQDEVDTCMYLCHEIEDAVEIHVNGRATRDDKRPPPPVVVLT